MTSVTTHHLPRSSGANHDQVSRATSRSVGPQLLRDLNQLFKVRVGVMVVLTTYIGYALAAAPGEGAGGSAVLAGLLVGVALACMGSSALNQVLERDTDALMVRTGDRPLPAGRMSSGWVAVVAITFAVLGVAVIAVASHPVAAVLCAATVVSYALIYTPMKRVSSLATIVGAVPGALPPAIGYTAVAGRFGLDAWLLCAILFVWQLPHFLAIAWLYREDYARAGIKVLPVVEPGGDSTFRQTLFGSMVLVPLTLLPAVLGISGVVYFAGALAAAGLMLGCSIALVIGRQDKHARAVFLASLVYLPVVSGLMVLDRLA